LTGARPTASRRPLAAPKIKESRHYFDSLTLLKQIGAQPKYRDVPTVLAHLVFPLRAPRTISAGMRPRVRRPVCARSRS
jgi:hypothetical protein